MEVSQISPPSPASHNAQLQRRTRLVVLAVMVGGLVVAHYATDPNSLLYHNIYRRSMYLPIILSAAWFGTRGGVLVALVAALLYAPHLFLQLKLPGIEEVDHAVEMLLYVIVGGLTGVLVERSKEQRERTEQALRRLERAHAESREHSTRLAQVQETLRQAERLSTLGEIAADLAHEIRNPLATMRATIQILAGNPPEPDRREFTQMLLGEIDRLDSVVESYLRAARPAVVDRRPSDAITALDSVIELTRRQAERDRIVVQRNGAESLVVAVGLAPLTQVFMNLTLNAIQAMPEGGRLRIDCRAFRGQEDRSDEAQIAFADTGPGVAARDRDSIFRPFFTTRPSGTGLGLSIARHIVEQHGGSLTLDEPQDGGAVFRLRLPLREA